MSKSKSYNRIVFLTTLSVYLGLVLVGGTAPVLAHTAFAKGFDIKNEIEVKDDLDKKPDNEEIEDVSNDDFPTLFAQLLNEIKNGVESGKIAKPLQTNFRFEGFFNLAEMCSGSGFGSDPSVDKYLATIVSDSFSQKFEPRGLELADYPRITAKNFRINFDATENDLLLKLSFGKSDAIQFAEFLNREYLFSARNSKDVLTKQVYENTRATSENNQVFIVTRLPRGSIDEFLARKDAQ